MLLFLKFYSWEGCPSFICLSHDNSKPLFEGCATPRRLSELTDTDYNDDDDDENEKQKRSFYESARRARKHDRAKAKTLYSQGIMCSTSMWGDTKQTKAT